MDHVRLGLGSNLDLMGQDNSRHDGPKYYNSGPDLVPIGYGFGSNWIKSEPDLLATLHE